MRLLKLILAVFFLAFAAPIFAAPAPVPSHIDLQFSHHLDEERHELRHEG